MPIPELATEIAFYETQRAELVQNALGKFALIKGEELVGTFDTEENAYKEGVSRFGTAPFLIQQILPDDRIEDIPAHFLGLLNAGF